MDNGPASKQSNDHIICMGMIRMAAAAPIRQPGHFMDQDLMLAKPSLSSRSE